MMLDTMEEMLEAGFAPEYSISFANNCMSRRNEGRTFTTFDMAVIDMYDGVLRSYKQGAAVTYIVSPGDDGNGLEIITSTTLPVGVLDEADCDEKEVQLAAGDAVVMISDGITDMDDDDRMTDILKKIYIGDSKKMVDEILGGMIGKGKRSQAVQDAIVRNKAVYFAAVGGAGALLSKCIKRADVIAYDDLGTEAIRRLEIEDLPAIVVIDSEGNNLYETAVKEYAEE